MTIVRCLYCDAENDAAATSGYCDGCGHKLPPASLARRRRLYAAGPGAAEEEDRPRPARQAANLLFSVAVLQVVAGGLLLILGPLAAEQVTADFLPRVITGSVVLLLLFAGLGWWALRRPFPAAVAGLVVFVLLAFLDAILWPALALYGLPVQVLFAVLLVQAVRTARRNGPSV